MFGMFGFARDETQDRVINTLITRYSPDGENEVREGEKVRLGWVKLLLFSHGIETFYKKTHKQSYVALSIA